MSRALSRPDKVREETRRRVEAAVAKTGYVVNSFASTLRSGRSSIIAVFASNLQNQHFANVMQGCSDALEGSGFHLLMAQAGIGEDQQREVVESVVPFRPAAMLFTDLLKPGSIRSLITAQGVPIMEMWDQRHDPADMLVTISEHDNGRLMGDHFARQGFRKIAYAGQLYDRGQRRLAGFREALGEHGLECSAVVPVERGWDIEAGLEALETIRRTLPDCDAVFFGTDMLAVGGLVHARRSGVRVPEDLAIAGFGDIDLARHMDPPLTSLFIASYDMGLTAGQMLLKSLRHEAIANRVVSFPLRLQERASTGRRN